MSGVDKDLMLDFVAKKALKKVFNERLKEINADLAQLTTDILAQMVDEGVKKIGFEDPNDDGLNHSLSLGDPKSFASAKDADTFNAYLSEHGLDSMRKVPPATLSAWFNKEAPEEVRDTPEAFGLSVFEKRKLYHSQTRT